SVGTAQNTNDWYAYSSVPKDTDYLGKATVSASSAPTGPQLFTPFDFRHWDDDMMQQWTFVIERALGKNSSIRASYIGTHGSRLEQRWAYNDPISVWNYQATTGLLAPNTSAALRFNPNWSGQQVQHNGYSNSQSIQLEYNHRFAHGLTAQVFYTFNHAMTTTDAGGSTSGDGNIAASGSGYSFNVPMNGEILGNPSLSRSERLRLGYTNSGDIPPQHIRWNGVYELPFGKGKQFAHDVSSWVDQIIGGWSVSFIGEWYNGQYMGVNSGLFLFGDPVLSSGDRVKTNIFGLNQQVYFKGYFDSSQAQTNAQAVQALVPTDFSKRVLTKVGNNNNMMPQTLKDGSVVYTNVASGQINWNSRNFILSPHQWNQDLSLRKAFTIKERYRLMFSGDFFNAFNHPNESNPNTTTGLVNLGVQPNSARIIQVSGRFEF
ncbi:MAG TPA: hypothetical protein VMV94_18220, partial [Phycisphaerae bacterium]|nr:hypothetical protein [Phycisphaerae bacterium]